MFAPEPSPAQAKSSSEVADFKRLSIPLVRRVYPSLMAGSLVSAQPLMGPTSLIHYLRMKYGQRIPASAVQAEYERYQKAKYEASRHDL